MTTELNHADEEANIDVPEGFHVHDAATANWVVRKVVEARQYGDSPTSHAMATGRELFQRLTSTSLSTSSQRH